MVSSNFSRLVKDKALVVAVLIALAYFSLHMMFLLQFKHLPSPPFGGDMYRDRGFVENILDGNPPWSDSYYLGELAYYPWLYPLLAAGIVKLTGLGVDKAMLWLSAILSPIFIITMFFLGRTILKNGILALLLAMLALASRVGLGSNHWAAIYITLPLFFLFFAKAWISTKWKHIILAGVFLGLTGLTHGAKFLVGLGVLVLSLVFELIYQFMNKKRFNNPNSSKPNLKNEKPYNIDNTINNKRSEFKRILNLGVAVLIAIAISSLFFLPSFIRYHYKVYNPVTKYGNMGIQHLGVSWWFKTAISPFFSRLNYLAVITGVLSIIGLLFFLINYKLREYRLVLYWLFADYILFGHHLITRPLFNTWFVPGELVYYVIISELLVIAGVTNIYKTLKLQERLKQVLVITFTIILIVLPMFITNLNNYTSSRWFKYGKQFDTSTRLLYDIGKWFKTNVKNDEVTLSFDESGFMLTALSGKKVLITRRTHASYFVDIDKRIADAAVIMYGNNSKKTEELVSKYNIKYFYLDPYLLTQPLVTTLKFEAYLSHYNISFEKKVWRLDPAAPLEQAFLTELLIIPPQNFSKTFLNSLKKVKEWTINNQQYAIVYNINPSSQAYQ